MPEHGDLVEVNRQGPLSVECVNALLQGLVVTEEIPHGLPTNFQQLGRAGFSEDRGRPGHAAQGGYFPEKIAGL